MPHTRALRLRAYHTRLRLRCHTRSHRIPYLAPHILRWVAVVPVRSYRTFGYRYGCLLYTYVRALLHAYTFAFTRLYTFATVVPFYGLHCTCTPRLLRTHAYVYAHTTTRWFAAPLHLRHTRTHMPACLDALPFHVRLRLPAVHHTGHTRFVTVGYLVTVLYHHVLHLRSSPHVYSLFYTRSAIPITFPHWLLPPRLPVLPFRFARTLAFLPFVDSPLPFPFTHTAVRYGYTFIFWFTFTLHILRTARAWLFGCRRFGYSCRFWIILVVLPDYTRSTHTHGYTPYLHGLHTTVVTSSTRFFGYTTYPGWMRSTTVATPLHTVTACHTTLRLVPDWITVRATTTCTVHTITRYTHTCPFCVLPRHVPLVTHTRLPGSAVTVLGFAVATTERATRLPWRGGRCAVPTVTPRYPVLQHTLLYPYRVLYTTFCRLHGSTHCHTGWLDSSHTAFAVHAFCSRDTAHTATPTRFFGCTARLVTLPPFATLLYTCGSLRWICRTFTANARVLHLVRLVATRYRSLPVHWLRLYCHRCYRFLLPHTYTATVGFCHTTAAHTTITCGLRFTPLYLHSSACYGGSVCTFTAAALHVTCRVYVCALPVPAYHAVLLLRFGCRGYTPRCRAVTLHAHRTRLPFVASLRSRTFTHCPALPRTVRAFAPTCGWFGYAVTHTFTFSAHLRYRYTAVPPTFVDCAV